MRSLTVTLIGLAAVGGSEPLNADDSAGLTAGTKKPWFVDPRRLPEITVLPSPEAVEAARKAEEQKRVLDETAARLKAEEERHIAQEAETQRQVKELKRLNEEAKAKADEDRARAEAEARQNEAAKPTAGPAAKSAPIRASTNIPAYALTCPSPAISTEPTQGGRTKIAVKSSCRANQTIEVKYGPIVTARALDGTGSAEFLLDLFLGGEVAATLTLADGEQHPLALPAQDLGDVTKVAIIWNSKVNLDLNAFEYAAVTGEEGYVWAGAPRDVAAAAALVARDGRGHGFMSSTDDGQHEGAKVEVFTLMRSKGQDKGTIAMALDYAASGTASNGACAAGSEAEVAVEVVVRDFDGAVSHENGVIPAVGCASARPASGRYLKGIVPDLRIRH
ncbi:MAG: hypothetical protein WC807_11990 [Hyphomicrobium sp.]